MKVKEKLHSTQLLMVAYNLALLVVGAVIIAADDQPAPSPAPALTPKQLALPGCPSTCGDVQIPYPFGIGTTSSTPGDNQKPCYLQRRFKLTCNNDSKLYKGNLQVLHIDILQGQMDVSFDISRSCSSEDNNPSKLTSTYFSISRKENKFVTVGCDSYGYLESVYNESSYSTGCLTRCSGSGPSGLMPGMFDDGTCSGIGCCQVDIPPGQNEEYQCSIHRIILWETAPIPLLSRKATIIFLPFIYDKVYLPTKPPWLLTGP